MKKLKNAAETLISNIDRAIEVAKDYYAVSGYQQFTRTLTNIAEKSPSEMAEM